MRILVYSNLGITQGAELHLNLLLIAFLVTTSKEDKTRNSRMCVLRVKLLLLGNIFLLNNACNAASRLLQNSSKTHDNIKYSEAELVAAARRAQLSQYCGDRDNIGKK